MSSIWDIFNPSAGWSNPANKAMPYLNNIPAVLQPLFAPFINTGNQSMSQYSDMASRLANPSGAINNYDVLAGGYTQSPGYQYNVDQATQAANQAAAASGMAGTPASQAALANDISGMADRDFNNYMGSVTGMQHEGLGELGDLTHLGFNASDEYSQDLLKMLMEQAGLAYAGQSNKNRMNMLSNAQNENTIGNIFGATIGGLLSL